MNKGTAFHGLVELRRDRQGFWSVGLADTGERLGAFKSTGVGGYYAWDERHRSLFACGLKRVISCRQDAIAEILKVHLRRSLTRASQRQPTDQ